MVFLKGKLIAFEGIDGSGKATQAKLLQSFLKSKGMESIVTGEPVYGTPTGDLISQILHSKEKRDPFSFQLLFSVDRAFHVSNLIEPSLQKGIDVILDRYFMSTIAVAVATGVKEEALATLKKVNATFPYPDLIFILDIDHKEASRRMRQIRRVTEPDRKMDEIEKNLELTKKIRETFLEISKEYKNTFVIDGNRTVEEISKEVLKIVETKLL